MFSRLVGHECSGTASSARLSRAIAAVQGAPRVPAAHVVLEISCQFTVSGGLIVAGSPAAEFEIGVSWKPDSVDAGWLF
jgi:hypothetical protein